MRTFTAWVKQWQVGLGVAIVAATALALFSHWASPDDSTGHLIVESAAFSAFLFSTWPGTRELAARWIDRRIGALNVPDDRVVHRRIGIAILLLLLGPQLTSVGLLLVFLFWSDMSSNARAWSVLGLLLWSVAVIASLVAFTHWIRRLSQGRPRRV